MWRSPLGLEIHFRKDRRREERREGKEGCFDLNPGLLEGPKLSNFESQHEKSCVLPTWEKDGC